MLRFSAINVSFDGFLFNFYIHPPKKLNCQIPAVRFTRKNEILITVLLIIRWHLAHSYLIFLAFFFVKRKSSIIVLSHPDSHKTFLTLWVKSLGNYFSSILKVRTTKKCIKLKITRLALIPKYNEKAL